MKVWIVLGLVLLGAILLTAFWGTPIEFVMKDKYALGEDIEIKIRNTRFWSYLHARRPECSNLDFYYESRKARWVERLGRTLEMPPRKFFIPRGYCHMPGEAKIWPLQEVVLLTWRQDACFRNAFRCDDRIGVNPGRYRIVGKFSTLGRDRKTVAEHSFIITCADGSDPPSAGVFRFGFPAVASANTTPSPPPPPACPGLIPSFTAALTSGCFGAALEISVKGDTVAFDNDRCYAMAGTEVVLIFDNVSSFLQHNWVLVRAGTKEEVAKRGLEAGPDHDWVKPGDLDVITHTKSLDPREIDEVRFTAPEPGSYQFICTVPGHTAVMFGDFVVTP